MIGAGPRAIATALKLLKVLISAAAQLGELLGYIGFQRRPQLRITASPPRPAAIGEFQQASIFAGLAWILSAPLYLCPFAPGTQALRCYALQQTSVLQLAVLSSRPTHMHSGPCCTRQIHQELEMFFPARTEASGKSLVLPQALRFNCRPQ